MKLIWPLLLTIFLCSNLYAQDIAKEIIQVSTLSKDQRYHHWAHKFINLPYGDKGPLGEGRFGEYDQDPLYRFDLFDCTTFVETIISLSQNNNYDDFQKQMQDIRYQDGYISYLTRHHFISLSWINANEQLGYFTDVTADLGFRTLEAQAMIEQANWIKMHKIDRIQIPNATFNQRNTILQDLRNSARHLPNRLATLDYLPLVTLLKNWGNFKNNVSSVNVVNFVRPNWNLRQTIGTNLNISHQGLMLKEHGQIFLIHASPSGGVKKELLKNYLLKFRNSPTLKGINLLRL